MKKSALLAVSALSLGVVGLATFTPIVNAATGMHGNATVNVSVASELSIGGEDLTVGQDKESQTAFKNFNVNFGTITAGELAAEGTNSADDSFTKTVTVMNNSGYGGALTVQGSSLHSTAPNSTDIPVGTTIQAGTSAWSVKTDGDWLDITTPKNVGSDDGLSGSHDYTVTYGLSTNKTQVAGDYHGTATYTYTITDLDLADLGD